MVEPAEHDYSSIEFWDALVQQDPRAVAGHVERARRTGRGTVNVLTRWATARAEFDLGRLSKASDAARAALAEIDDATPVDVRWAVVMSSAAIVAESGSIDDGLALLDELGGQGSGADVGRIELQRAYILHHAGRLNESLACLDSADRLLGPSAHERDRYRVHQNRGLVLLQQGRFDAAEADLLRSEDIALGAQLHGVRAMSIANRAVLYGRSRRLSDSIRCFAEAAQVYAAAGSPARQVALSEIDRAEVMMHSGLVADAVDAAQRALGLVAATSNRVLVGDAQLLVARTELEVGHLTAAERSAQIAASVLDSSGRREMVPQAQAVGAHARLRRSLTGDAVADEIRSSEGLVVELRTHGWHRQADDLALERVRHAARVDRLELVREDLTRLRRAADSEQRDLALVGLLAEAIALRHDGDVDAATATAKRGLDRLDDIVGEARTLEERSGAMRLGSDLSQLMIELAVERRDADTVFAAAEGTRARALHDELDHADRHRPLTDDGAEQLRNELAARLGERTLIEWVVALGRVLAVVCDTSGRRLIDVAPVSDVVRARDHLLVHLDLATADPDGSSVRASRAAELLDQLLLGPLGLTGDEGIVMVPVDLLHGVPWSGLPTLASRPFALTPNAQIWLEADRRAGAVMRSVGLVVGPAVEGAARERSEVERLHPRAAVASGAGASATTVASMLAGHDMVHIAAHGRFRSDRPLLSTLRLHDGEADLHETIPSQVGARLVVLSSCEGGAQGTSDGSEVLGLAAVLLARGAASVIAPLTSVRDLECAEFVAEVHAELSAGIPVARSVANVRERWLTDDDLSRWAVASSFSCFGSGAATVAPRS